MLGAVQQLREQVRQIEATAPLSCAVEGRDWYVSRSGAHVEFKALTPIGAVYLGELAEVGFFGAETAQMVRDIA